MGRAGSSDASNEVKRCDASTPHSQLSFAEANIADSVCVFEKERICLASCNHPFVNRGFSLNQSVNAPRIQNQPSTTLHIKLAAGVVCYLNPLAPSIAVPRLPV